MQYIDDHGKTLYKASTEVTVIDSNNPLSTLGSNDDVQHWYLVRGDVTITERITVTGDVRLILEDDASLKATGGIEVNNDNSLTVYAQSTGDDTGSLTATGGGNQAGIGGGNISGSGTIIINGGTVTAKGGENGAGIGGGYYGDGGNITITGGEVDAEGGKRGAGLGGGNYGDGGNITITGGEVYAESEIGGAGIGGGDYGGGGTINISGGTITATGGELGAGIGGGYDTRGGTINISGGNIIATGGQEGAGIGGGPYCSREAIIEISGGTITATGGELGAGIGVGLNSRCDVTITINGGTVIATGGQDGAGVGTGNNSHYSIGDVTITINGGTVTATGDGAAGIGDGYGNNGGRFSTGTGGHAVIFASSISDDDSTDGWSGIIINGDEGQVYGDQTLVTDLTLEENHTLTVPEGTTLTVSEDVTFTNHGTVDNQGTFTNNGTVYNYGKFTNNGTFTNNGRFYNYGTFENNGTFTNDGTFYSDSEIGNTDADVFPLPESEVLYLDERGDEQHTKKGTEVTVIDPSYTSITLGSDGAEQWYLVRGNVTITERITVTGDVRLILEDNASLEATGGIEVNTDNSLTVYAQSTGDSMGSLTATGGDKQAGIGSGVILMNHGRPIGENTGTITINGGTVTAKGGTYGAGIGACYHGRGGTITINGGAVFATGGDDGAGIGCGQYGGGTTVNITINGGAVFATGGENGAGIGGSYYGTNYVTITINGGTVDATGGDGGAGIGGGLQSTWGDITINGGTVTATGEGASAGIGSGSDGRGGTITIDGGTVTATGDQCGAGIGGGFYGKGNLTITINGGTVTATGGDEGAGIGGGYSSTGDMIITIKGGTVTANGGEGGAGIGDGHNFENYGINDDVTITIDGGTVTATGGDNGAGIGGGYSSKCGMTITITEGTVTATGGDNGAGICYGYPGYVGTFSTGDKGHAVIITNSIGDISGSKKWGGIIINGDQGQVYGNQNLKTDLELGPNVTLTVPEAVTLIVSPGITLTVPHVLEVEGNLIVGDSSPVPGDNGKVTGTGEMTGKGTVTNYGAIDLNIDAFRATVTLTFEGAEDGSADIGSIVTVKAEVTFNSKFVSDGTVEFYVDGTPMEPEEFSNGVATLKITLDGSDYAVGPHSISAKFTPKGYTSPFGNTGTSTLTVTKLDSELVPECTSTVTYGDEITMTVTVKGSDGSTAFGATGTVTLSNGTIVLASSSNPSGGVYTLTYGTSGKGLSVGSNSLTVTYSGDGAYTEGSAVLTFSLERRQVAATVSGVPSKTYDGGTDIEVSLAFAEGSLVGGDVLTGTVQGRFDDPDAGSDKTITIDVATAEWSDALVAGYYSISLPESAMGSITGGPSTDVPPAGPGQTIPPYIDDTTDIPPSIIVTDDGGDDGTVTIVACAAAGVLAALTAMFVWADRRS